MEAVTAEDMRSALGSYDVKLTDDALVDECVHICYTLGLTAGDLATKLTRYSLNHDVDEISALDLKGVQQEHNKALASARKAPPVQASPSSVTHEDVATRHSNSFLSAFIGGSTAEELKKAQTKSAQKDAARKRHNFTSPTTPKRGVGQPVSVNTSPLSAEMTPGLGSYGTRAHAGTVALSFPAVEGKAEPLTPIDQTVRSPVAIQVFPNCVEKPYRFMFEKLLDKAEILDMRIDEMAERIVKKNKLLAPPAAAAAAAEAATENGDEPAQEQQTQLAHVGMPTQEPVIVAGRICSEALSEGKLNDQSIMLEGSRETSNGARVKLDLRDAQALPAFSLFPGQIVAVEATNTDGDALRATAIYQGCPAPKKKTAPSELVQLYFPPSGEVRQAVDVVVAAGPYTTVDDLSYAPLDDLLAVIKRDRPDVFIALGPFVDANHPMVQAGEVDVVLEELYQDIVAKMVEAIEDSDNKHTQLVIIPALNDVTHDYVFPQAPNPSIDHERVFFFPNPCTFMVQELTFGCTTNDVLSDIFKNEAARPKKDLTAVANHLIEQRSYYPLFPPEAGVNFDMSHVDNVAMPTTPDVLLLPSKLRFFAKDVNGTLVVNPGRLTKFRSGGTYGHIRLDAPHRNDIPMDERPLLAGAVARSTVQIRKI